MTLLTMRDVTSERLTARRLLEAQEQLIRSEKQTAIMELAGAAAHELNQPLTSVLTSLAIFKRLANDGVETPLRLLEAMEQEVDRMTAIIRKLSSLTDYTTRQYVGDARIVDLEGSAEKSTTEADKT
jgi:signal transduction histidine kinase